MACQPEPRQRQRAGQDPSGIGCAKPGIARCRASFNADRAADNMIVEDAEPLRIRVAAHGLLKHDSDLLIDQLRAIDNRRLTEGPLTRCDDKLMARVYDAICDVLEM